MQSLCECADIKTCKCGLIDKIRRRNERTSLVQFFMKLNDEYENVRGQIMAMDPLPTTNKAYYMV